MWIATNKAFLHGLLELKKTVLRRPCKYIETAFLKSFSRLKASILKEQNFELTILKQNSNNCQTLRMYAFLKHRWCIPEERYMRYEK